MVPLTPEDAHLALQQRYNELKKRHIDDTLAPLTEKEAAQFGTLINIEHRLAKQAISFENLTACLMPLAKNGLPYCQFLADAADTPDVVYIKAVGYLESHPNSALQQLCSLSERLRDAADRKMAYDDALLNKTLSAEVSRIIDQIDYIVRKYVTDDRLILLYEHSEYLLLARSLGTTCEYRVVDKSTTAPHPVCAASSIAPVAAYILKQYYKG